MHLEPEATADVGRDHTHPRLGQLERRGQCAPHDARRLGRRPHRQRLAVPVGNDASRLEWQRREPPVAEGLAHDEVRVVERAFDVAAALGASEQHGVGAERLVQRRAGRPHVVVDADPLDHVGRRTGGGRDHHGHRLAAEARLARECGPRRRREAAAAHPRRQVGDSEISGSEHRNGARGVARGHGVDALHGGVGMRAADERRVQHTRQHDVVDVAPLPTEQPRILHAFHPRAGIPNQEPPFTRGSTSPAMSSSCSRPQSSGLSTIQSTPLSSAAMRALIRSATSSAVPSR